MIASGFGPVAASGSRRGSIALAIATSLLLLAGGPIEPASAAATKRSRTYKTAGDFATGNPFSLRGHGVTRGQFELACAVPESQGVDGYVIDLPRPLRSVPSEVAVAGTGAGDFVDLDLYFFDKTCTETARLSTAEPFEYGTMPAGTRYVLVSAFLGADVSFAFEATR